MFILFIILLTLIILCLIIKHWWKNRETIEVRVVVQRNDQTLGWRTTAFYKEHNIHYEFLNRDQAISHIKSTAKHLRYKMRQKNKEKVIPAIEETTVRIKA